MKKQKIQSSKNSYGNVLILSSAAKVSLIEAVRSGTSKISKEIKIIGGDLSSNVVSAYFVDEFWEMPRLDEIDLDEFVNECIHRKITVIIPSRDGELEFFSKNKDFLLSKGIYVMVSSKDVINKCIDKLEFSKQENLSIIPSSKTIKEIKSEKFVVKERFGAGSHSIGINLSCEEAITHSKNLTDPIYQPFISGKELSVDAYIDNKKNIKGIVMRERVLVVNGESQITKTIIDQPLENSFFKIINSMNLYGHIILQAIVDEESNIHVIECNPRFGGASAISIKSGLDSFYWLYLESRGEDIQRHKFMKINREIKQVRSHRDTYL